MRGLFDEQGNGALRKDERQGGIDERLKLSVRF